jgi:UDP-glucose 4-epimerase
VVGSKVYALTPTQGDLRDFSLSKFALFDDAQHSAVLAFLATTIGHEDVDEALEYWHSEVRGSRPRP